MTHLTALMRDIRHWSLKDQVFRLNQVLRGHYAYYGVAGNWRSLHKVYRFVERYLAQDALQSELGGENHVGSLSSIERPVSVTATDDLPDLWADAITRCAVKAKSTSDERSAGNRHATFCGSRERVTAPGDPVGGPRGLPLLSKAFWP
jgi:hypothetical protein